LKGSFERVEKHPPAPSADRVAEIVNCALLNI
jgi:hypothetical protein